MIRSTRRHGSRVARALGLSSIALLLVAAGCSSDTGQQRDPSISAKEDRNSAGMLEGLTVTGKHFTPSGTVLMTVLMAASGPNASPYFEEEIQADASGNIKYEKRPVPCPQTPDYKSGSWTLVTARDMSSGISGSDSLHPGSTPDCTG
jgi:hypothetical protein